MGGRTKSGDMTAKGKRDLDAMLDRWKREPKAISIDADTVSLTGQPKQGNGAKVRALIPVRVEYTETVDVEAEVVAWTPRAIKVRAVIDPHQVPVEVWVWASAVMRTPE